MTLTRRHFITGGLSLGAATAIGGVGWSGISAARSLDVTEDLELVELSIPVRDLPADLHGYRIGFLTDLHLGVAISADFISTAFASVLSARVDLLLLGGDYIWIAESALGLLLQPTRSPSLTSIQSRTKLSERIFHILARLIPHAPPKDGIFWVFGNHDRWAHPTACETTLADTPAQLLKNSAIEIRRGSSSILIVGTDDYLTGVPQIPSLRRERRGPTILLTHNPDHVGSLAERGLLAPSRSTSFAAIHGDRSQFDLALCGHTHGGQVHLPFIGPVLFNIRHHRFGAGLVREGETWVYTSRGLGVVEFPYRIGCRPEATVIVLERGDAA